MSGESPDVTDLLLRWSAGDRSALERLTPVIYDDLRKMARGLLGQERPDHTLSATALVHEVYLKLVDQRRVQWKNRAHFFGAAAHIMRRVLVLEQDVRTPRSLHPDLAAILKKSLRKEPERRYATAERFADDLRRFRRGLPVSAQPETMTYQLRRFVSRHRLAVSVAALVVASLLALTGIAWRQARIADDQRARAEQVTNFMTGFLGATPSGPDWALQNKGISLRVVELADLMSERVGGELGSQPEAER